MVVNKYRGKGKCKENQHTLISFKAELFCCFQLIPRVIPANQEQGVTYSQDRICPELSVEVIKVHG